MFFGRRGSPDSQRRSLAALEEVPPVVVVLTGAAGDLLLANGVGGVRVALVGVQSVVRWHVHQPHNVAVCPRAIAFQHFHPPVVVAVTDTVGPKAGDLLLPRHRRGETAVAVEVLPGKHMLEAYDLAVLD